MNSGGAHSLKPSRPSLRKRRTDARQGTGSWLQPVRDDLADRAQRHLEGIGHRCYFPS
jgi:hypothetical protein